MITIYYNIIKNLSRTAVIIYIFLFKKFHTVLGEIRSTLYTHLIPPNILLVLFTKIVFSHIAQKGLLELLSRTGRNQKKVNKIKPMQPTEQFKLNYNHSVFVSLWLNYYAWRKPNE